ncbi:conjugal transfer protein TrbL family protein [Spirillospora sp. NPDC127200]
MGCTGKTKIKASGLNPMPQLLCEVSPGKWVPIDPRTAVHPAPGEKTCPGRQKTVIQPGATLPDIWCETEPGQWHQHPASPYKAINKALAKTCTLTDVSCMAGKAINGWLADLVDSAKKPVLDFLAATVLGTPDVASGDMQRAREMWGTSRTIANTCFLLIITLAGVLLMAGQSLPGELSPQQLLPRMVWAFVGVNLSLLLIGYAVQFANGLSAAFLNGGPEKMNVRAVADVIAGSMLANLATGGAFLPLVSIVVLVLAVCVAFIYVIRLAITMLLIAAAPLALMFGALPYTEGIARSWWRAFAGVMAIQVLQSLVLVTAFRLLFTEATDSSGSFLGIPTKNDLIDLLLAIALLWVLIKIPSWVARGIWQQAQPRMLGRLIKTFIVYRGIGALMSRAGRGAAPRGVRHRAPARPTPGQPPGPRPPGPRRPPHRPPPSPPPRTPATPPVSPVPPAPMPPVSPPQPGTPPVVPFPPAAPTPRTPARPASPPVVPFAPAGPVPASPPRPASPKVPAPPASPFAPAAPGPVVPARPAAPPVVPFPVQGPAPVSPRPSGSVPVLPHRPGPPSPAGQGAPPRTGRPVAYVPRSSRRTETGAWQRLRPAPSRPVRLWPASPSSRNRGNR